MPPFNRLAIFLGDAGSMLLGLWVAGLVLGLAERIDLLQDTDRETDLARLAQLARELAADAEELGYEALAGVAQLVKDAALEEKSDEAHANLVKLTEVAYRIRLGHRGAL